MRFTSGSIATSVFNLYHVNCTYVVCIEYLAERGPPA